MYRTIKVLGRNEHKIKPYQSFPALKQHSITHAFLKALWYASSDIAQLQQYWITTNSFFWKTSFSLERIYYTKLGLNLTPLTEDFLKCSTKYFSIDEIQQLPLDLHYTWVWSKNSFSAPYLSTSSHMEHQISMITIQSGMNITIYRVPDYQHKVNSVNWSRTWFCHFGLGNI